MQVVALTVIANLFLVINEKKNEVDKVDEQIRSGISANGRNTDEVLDQDFLQFLIDNTLL